MPIYDFKKVLKPYLSAKARRPEIVNIPAFKFLSITDKGDPNGKEFGIVCGALYSLHFTVKFTLKKRFVVDARREVGYEGTG
jgi:hypothetical protein